MKGISSFCRWAGIGLWSMVTAVACLSPQTAFAGTGAITGNTPGSTPFISNVAATLSGGTLQSVTYEITPKPGSVTRPLVTSYTAQYLTSAGDLNGNAVVVPVFGLYAGFQNSVNVYFYFTDGTESIQTTNITTAAYTDPCSTVNSPTLTQNRVNTTDLNFDYFLLKDTCSTNDPAIVDTDSNFRWVGHASDGTSAVALYNNTIYMSNGSTGILQMPLTTAVSTKIADFSAAPYNVTFTGHHNIDPGRDGLIDDVNTSAQTEAAEVEFNPATGAVLNFWDFGQIITYTMTLGGDNAASFVKGTSADWFHNNASTYNPADNTLIVSSRENFVMAVDYDTPSDGQKKIHWILGDTTKAWYAFPSLRALMLAPTNSATLPPIGQHGLSIDHNGNLLLFDDGFQSQTQSPQGISRNYTAVREFQINSAAMTATAGPVYYSPTPTIYDNICGSVYDVNGTYLVDYPAVVNGASLVLRGLGGPENLVFNLNYPANTCNGGWNSFPLRSNSLTYPAAQGFAIQAAAPTMTVSPGASLTNQLVIHDIGGFNGPVALSVSGFPNGVTASITPNNPAITTTSLAVNVSAGTAPGTYFLTIAGNSGDQLTGTAVALIVPGPQTLAFPAIPAQAVGTLGLNASVSSGLAVSYTSSTTSICTISGNFATLLGAGTCTITASQAGNANFPAVTPVTQSFPVTSAGFSITAANPTMTVAAGASVSNQLTINDLGGFSGAVTLSVSGLPNTVTAGITPNPTTTTTSLTVSVPGGTAPGTYPVTITGTSGSVTTSTALSFIIPMSQTITFPAVQQPIAGLVEFLGASSSAALPISYSSSTNSVCTVSGSSATLLTAGTCTITAAQSGSANFQAATPVQQSFQIEPAAGFSISAASPTLTVAAGSSSSDGLTIVDLGSFEGSVTLTLSGVPSGVTASITPNNPTASTTNLAVSVPPGTAAGSYPITINGVSGALSASTQVTLTISAGPTSQTITFNPVASQTVGATVSLSASATSGLAVTFASSTGSICSVNGSSASFIAAGTCTLTAAQSGNSSYAAAPTVSQNVTVSLKSQTISFNSIPAQTVGSTLTLAATASSGLPVTFSIVQNGNCSLSGNVVTLLAPGNCGVNANQSGNSTYAAAPAVGQIIVVNAAPLKAQTISFATPAPQTVGTPLTLTATATSGLAVSYTSATTSVCTVSGSTASFVAAGTCTLTASQAGNSTYAAAPSVPVSFTVKASAAAPSFTLSAASPSITVSRGSNAKDLITVSGLGGFKGSVSLSVSGLPFATFSTFSANPTANTTSFTVYPFLFTPTGTYTVTITGKSGSLSATTKIALTIK